MGGKMTKNIITVCMGSSCFTRGNKINLEIIQSYLGNHGLTGEIHLTGALCQKQCRRGPVITINNKDYCGVEPSDLPDLLSAIIKPREKDA